MIESFGAHPLAHKHGPDPTTPPDPSLRKPVTIIGGFLGSGKTTLLNYLLAQERTLHKELIIREYGALPIDHELIEDESAEIVLVSGGCLFMDPQTTLYWALANLYSRADYTGGGNLTWQDVDFDYVLLETSGLDMPEYLAGLFFLDRLRDHYRLDSYIVVVDAEYGELCLDEYRRASEQVAFADILLINKVDLVDQDTIRRLEERLRRINVLARIYHTEYTQIDLDKLLNVRLFNAPPSAELVAAMPSETRGANGKEEGTMDPFQSVTLTETRPLDREKVNAWIEELFAQRGLKILRSKGFLNFAGYDHRFVFQGVRMTFHSRTDRLWKPDEERKSTIVLIGEGLDDTADLQCSFSECVAQAPLSRRGDKINGGR